MTIKDIFDYLEEITFDGEFANLQLVLNGLKPAACFELIAVDISMKGKNLSGRVKNCNLSDELYWYVKKHNRNCIEVFIVNRTISNNYNHLFPKSFHKNKEISCFEQVIISESFRGFQEQFGILMGYPVEVAKEFNREMESGAFRPDRIKKFNFFTSKDQVGFISYPEHHKVSTVRLEEWMSFMSLLGIRVYSDSGMENELLDIQDLSLKKSG